MSDNPVKPSSSSTLQPGVRKIISIWESRLNVAQKRLALAVKSGSMDLDRAVEEYDYIMKMLGFDIMPAEQTKRDIGRYL